MYGETGRPTEDNMLNGVEHVFDCVEMGQGYSFSDGEVTFTSRLVCLGLGRSPANNNSLDIQSCAEKKDCFAKHQPGVAGCGWLQPGRNFLST